MNLKPIPPKLRAILEEINTPPKADIDYDTSIKYNGTGASPYGMVALQRQCEAIRVAIQGSIHDTIRDASFSIGRLVAGGEIDYGLALAQLTEAAIDRGANDDDIGRTLPESIEAGREHPKSSMPLGDDDNVNAPFYVVDCPDGALLFGPLIDTVPDDTPDNLQLWALDNIEYLSNLSAVELARFKIELGKRGVKKGFLDRELGRVIKEVKQNAPQPEMTDEERESLWEKCVDDMRSLGYTFRMNEMDDCVEVNGERISDGLDAQIIMGMYDKGWNNQGDGGAGYIRLAWTAQAYQNRYHPVRDFLNGLVWDGKDWIAELEKYVRDKHPQIVYEDGHRMPVFGAFLRRWGIGAVGKILSTGDVRVQNPMLVLDGAQDAGKSTLVRFLCPMSDAYFIESHISPDSNDHARYLATRMVWEVGELGATTRKADRESLKAFLTKLDVTFRVPYARHPVTKPAVTSFIGTINPEIGFLNDPTGHRRFLPVEIASIDFDYKIKVDPLQLWAQFVHLYKSGELPKLTSEEKEMADSIRSGHEIEDQYAGFVTKYYTIDLGRTFASATNLEWSATTTDVVEQLAHNGVTGVNTTNVGLSLLRLGLIKARQRVNGIQETRWYGLKRNKIGFTTSQSGF